MNYNKTYKNYKCCKSDEGCSQCKSKQLESKKTLLECGQGSGSKTFTSSNDTPFQLAYVNIDTTCLNRPEVLIKFSSQVRLKKLEFNSRTVRLKYELFRTCNGEEPICLGIWMFEKADSLQERFTSLEESFNFIFCESSNCHGCCSYFVRVTPVEIINSTVTVSNGRMAALTQYSCDSICEDTQCMPIHLKQQDTILACGQGNGGIVFKVNGLRLPADIAHITIDTTCLNRPKALIEFSSIIKLSEDFDGAILQFELFRVCDDGDPVSRGAWIFEMVEAEELMSKAFSFIFCECETLSNCCEYFVKVIPIEIQGENDSDEEDDLTVYNARMTALAQSSKESNNCKLLYDKPKEILLKCGSGTGSRKFTSSSDQPFQLAHVTVDTTYFCKPIVNIQFSSIVSFQLVNMSTNGQDPDDESIQLRQQPDPNDASIQLRYELFRKCDNRRPISIGVWEFQMTNEEGGSTVSMIEGTESFDFTFCDCITCTGCCEYFVTVTAVEILEGPEILSVATVSNGRIAALAQEV